MTPLRQTCDANLAHRRRAPLRARARVSPARQPEQGHAAARRHRARHESADRRDHRLHARQISEAGRHRDSRERRRRRRQPARRPTLRERRQDAADQGRTLLRRSVDETLRETVNRTRRAPLRLEPALSAAEGDRIQLLDRGRMGRRHAAHAGRCACVAGRLRRRAHRRRPGIPHQTLTVKPDPRIHATRAELEQAFAFYRDVEGELATAWQSYGEVDAVHEQLEALNKNGAAAKAIEGSIEAFEKKLSPFREGKGEGAPNHGAIARHSTSLATDVEGADAVPTDSQRES